MNIAQLLHAMWRKRIEYPDYFYSYKATVDCFTYNILYRKAIVKATICADSEIYETSLEVVYADQNPNGKSKEAELVRSGVNLPHEIGWLYITELNERRLWLGKIVNGKPIPFVTGEYDKKTHTLNLSL